MKKAKAVYNLVFHRRVELEVEFDETSHPDPSSAAMLALDKAVEEGAGTEGEDEFYDTELVRMEIL